MFSISESHEPMLASPTSPGIHQYLPGYLLGDNVQHGISPAGPRLWSTGGHSPQKNVSYASPPLGGSSGTPRDHLSRAKDKGGAPPIKSLFLGQGADSSYTTPTHQSFTSQLPPRSAGTPAGRSVSPGPPTSGLISSCNTPRTGDSFVAPPSRIPTSPAQMDPFYTQGENLKSDDILDETWVTIFGFPPAATSFILQQFSQYGNIIKHISSMEGNWMHVHYQSKIQAKKALSKNGKVFGNSIMLGVLPCIDKSVMEDNKENASMMGTPTSNQSRIADTSSKSTPIRPLASAYNASRSDYEVVKGSQPPQKDNSFMSKVKEYMLGW